MRKTPDYHRSVRQNTSTGRTESPCNHKNISSENQDLVSFAYKVEFTLVINEHVICPSIVEKANINKVQIGLI